MREIQHPQVHFVVAQEVYGALSPVRRLDLIGSTVVVLSAHLAKAGAGEDQREASSRTGGAAS